MIILIHDFASSDRYADLCISIMVGYADLCLAFAVVSVRGLTWHLNHDYGE